MPIQWPPLPRWTIAMVEQVEKSDKLTACSKCRFSHEVECWHCGHTGQRQKLCGAVKNKDAFDFWTGTRPDAFCVVENLDGYCPHFKAKDGA